MFSHILKKIAIVSVTLLLFSSACDKKPCCENGEYGVIKDLTGLDGCSFVVELNNGDKLEVINFSDFDVKIENGNKISISYHEANDMMSICMVGKIVKADCICEE
jgi:hypothetical protein